MLQQRKKDYLQRLIEELSKKLYDLLNQDQNLSTQERKEILNQCFHFYTTHLDVTTSDSSSELIDKINDPDLLEYYAKLLMTDYDLSNQPNPDLLSKALTIVQYIQNTDTTYSWPRVVLREDLLRRLDQK